MPQDKHLIVTKTIVQQVARLCEMEKSDPKKIGIFIDFILPSVILQQEARLGDKMFILPHTVFAKDGRTSVLIVPKVIGLDCGKINKRHQYYDAVVIAETICKRGDEEATKRALQVAKTFSKFVVDSRIVNKLPPCIHAAVSTENTTVATNAKGIMGPSNVGAVKDNRKSKVIVSVPDMDDRESLGFALSQGCKGVQISITGHGFCSIRVGHGGMKSGDVCENAKQFIQKFKADFPHLYKFAGEYKLSSAKTESVRYMDSHM
eukprot:Tbor_TRINITY_DN2606_c0_g1::TRINITY_DN2606_c0_g1_i1::g.17882::m.17882